MTESRLRVGVYILLNLMLAFCAYVRADETDLVWSTFLGGSGGDWSEGIAVNDSGSVYVTGLTSSQDFPTTDGALDTALNNDDVFVAKFNSIGSALEYATFLGGDSSDRVDDIALDDSGSIYVTGFTASANFPTTIEAFDTTLDGSHDAFVAKLNPMGSNLEYATFLGGSGHEVARGIEVDKFGQVYVSGETYSDDFPTTAGAFDETYNGPCDVFMAKLNATGSALDYSTYLGGWARDHGGDIAVDSLGSAYITGMTISPDFPTTDGAFDTTHNGGWDVYVAKFNSAGNNLDYATFLGGSTLEWGFGIALDNTGNVHVTGETWSRDFPVTGGAFDTTQNDYSDAFVAKLNPKGDTLVYSTFLGGSSNETGYDIALDNAGNACLTGQTSSEDFPFTTGALDTTYNDGVSSGDVFVVKVNPTGSLLAYATFMGGDSTDRGAGIVIDGADNAYVTGTTKSSDFPTITGAFDTTMNGSSDIFVAKLSLIGSTPVVSETVSDRLPKPFSLRQNHPNPFNTNTEIQYHIPGDGRVTINIFNALGQRVRTLLDADQTSGPHHISWDGRDSASQQVASGVYFFRLRAGDFHKTIKMVLIK